MVAIEGKIAKELGLTWLDARDLVTETKLSLGLDEVNQNNETQVFEEALKIWAQKPADVQEKLRGHVKETEERVQHAEELRKAKLEKDKQEVGVLSTGEQAGILACLAICCCCLARN